MKISITGCLLLAGFNYVAAQLVNHGYYKIRNISSGKYICVAGANDINGANAVINDFLDENYFKWQLIEAGRGIYKFKNAGSGKCLGVGGGSRTAGSTIIQYDDVGQNDIKWEVSQFAGVPGQYGVVNNNSMGNGLQTGVIAQEVKAVMPELVSARDNGELTVNYNGLVPYLIEAIKEQQKQIESLEKKIDKLTQK